MSAPPLRVLVLSWAHPPETSATGVRWARIGEEFAARGHHVDVICVWQPGAPRHERRNGVHVHRVGGAITRAKAAFRDREPAAGAPTGTRRSARSAVRWLYDRTWKRLYWPDHAFPWLPSALRTASKLQRRTPYDAVVSVSFPFTSHLVAHALMRRVKSPVWVMDVLDPLSLVQDTPANNLLLYGRLNRAAERRTFARADRVVLTAPALLDAYRRLYPRSASRMTLLSHVADVAAADRAAGARNTDASPADPETGPVRLLFAGSLFRTIRSPAFLLRLVRQLPETVRGRRVELHMLGALNDCGDLVEEARKVLGDRLVIHGAVDRAAVPPHIRAASVLVSLGNTTPYQTPSKLAEYFASGKPVLHLAPVEEDGALPLIRQYPAALTLVDRGPAGDVSQVERLLQFLEDPPVPSRSDVERLVRPFRVETLADHYEDMFRRRDAS